MLSCCQLLIGNDVECKVSFLIPVYLHPERPNAGGGVGTLPYLADLFSTKIKFHKKYLILYAERN